MKTRKGNGELTRRDFIKTTAVSAIGASFLGSLPSFVKGAILNKSAATKSKVVLVQHSKVINANGEVDLSLLEQMLEKAIVTFSGESNSANFWNKHFTKEDVIGLKVNTLGLNQLYGSPAVNHFSALTNTIIKSCNAANFKEENFVVWDRSEEELTGAGYVIQKEKGKTRVLCNTSRKAGNGEGYSDQEFKVGEKTSRVSKILTEQTTVLINVPQMKDHGIAGVTGALKNHYGTINNPSQFHANGGTNPGIPEVNLIPVIKDKQKLIIMDALMSVYNGGPRWDRQYLWPFGGIIVSSDPVAIDTIMFGLINDKRKAEGLAPISEQSARHIKIAGDMGLGKYRPDEIDFVKINLG